MYRHLERRLVEHLREFLRRTYALEIANIVVEQPPKIEFGEYALPIAFELARKLRKAPRKIAEEIVAGVGAIPGFEKFEVAGGGYINVRVNRAELATDARRRSISQPRTFPPAKCWSSIPASIPTRRRTSGICATPFSAIHSSACCALRAGKWTSRTTSTTPECRLPTWWLDSCTSRRSPAPQIEALAAAPRFDYLCWDLYARVSHWYEEDKANLQARAATLHAIEEGNNETAAIADLISIAVLKRHLETMDRLDIEYDFLPRESEILHLHFWDAAFTKLKEAGVLTYESGGQEQRLLGDAARGDTRQNL